MQACGILVRSLSRISILLTQNLHSILVKVRNKKVVITRSLQNGISDYCNEQNQRDKRRSKSV